MNGQPGFLMRLGLDHEADERQVKRAYARELKLIDQERDLDGFQHLRACYETALAWAARRAAAGVGIGHAAPVPGPLPEADASAPAPDYRPRQPAAVARPRTVAPPAAPGAEPFPAPHALAQAVFADFVAGTGALAAASDAVKADEALRLAPWIAAVRAALADPRLMHLDARIAFEEGIAVYLAQGWRPGLHLLLPAAIEVFGWNEDRGALQRLGRPGWVLDAAIEQRAMFQSQTIKLRTEQSAALALLRNAAEPSGRTMRRHMRAVRALAAQFPDLLRIVAPQAKVEAWLERCPPTERELRQEAPAGPDQSRWWRPKSMPGLVFLIILLVRAATMFGAHESPQPPPKPQLFEHPGEPAPPAFPNADAVLRAQRDRIAPGGGSPPTDAQLDAIRARIEYLPLPGAAPGQQRASLLVSLDEKGFVTNIDVLSAASDPAFTAAVQLAIRRAAPFPPRTSRMFSVRFSDTPVQAGRAPLAVPSAAPAEARRHPVSAARMAVIRARIDYSPGADVPPGEQRVELELRLDAKGAIAAMKRVRMQGDPAWADAVEAAIRSTGPFAPDTARAFKLRFWVTVGQRPTPEAARTPP